VAASSKLQSEQARIALLVAGDSAAFLTFAAIGRSSHGEAAGLDAFLAVVGTAAPFLLGWLLVAPWLGAFRERAIATPALMLRTTLIAWAATLPFGLMLRAAMIGRLSPISFAVVTFIAVTVILGGWRLAYAFWFTRRQ
jgi:hypothetical protein